MPAFEFPGHIRSGEIGGRIGLRIAFGLGIGKEHLKIMAQLQWPVDDCRISEFEKMAEALGYEAKIVLAPKQEA